MREVGRVRGRITNVTNIVLMYEIMKDFELKKKSVDLLSL